jgi:ribonucleoside-diphosphate reductase alpha chain
MCAHTFDKWKDTDAVFNSTIFLDCINQDLIARGSKLQGLERVVASAVKGRALGLGLLGFHSYLQQKMIPFDGLQARLHNKIIFEHIQKESIKASKFMAEWLGEPEWLKGTGMRNSHLQAVAPNTSSAFFSGGQSQGIEPFVANVYTQKLAKVGAVDRMPPQLVKILKEKNKYTESTINSIVNKKGSVQHLKFLTDEEKQVFKTAYEINQKVLIDLAEQRQQYIDQGQSLNLFFSANEEEQWIHDVHKYAFDQKLLKSLYYVRTMAGITADKSDECLACEG